MSHVTRYEHSRVLGTHSMLDLPRVALILDATRPSGTVVYTLELGEALAARGVDVTILALDDAGAGLYRAPRCPSMHIPISRPATQTRATPHERVDALVRYLESTSARFDVYHAQDDIGGAALARLTASGRIPRFVRTVRHLDVADAEREARRALAIRSAAQVFAISRLTQQRLNKTYGVSATLLPSGVDATRFSAVTKHRRADLRAELGFADGPLFFVVGGIEPRNNMLAILEAFATVRITHANAVLAIAAAGSYPEHAAYEAAFDARAAELHLRLGSDVRVLGTLPDESFVTLMQAASALVSPSLVESFGLAVLEALACETPVVASRIAPFTEYLARDEALLVDPNDPFDIAEGMLNALEPAVAMVLATNARESAIGRTWDACAQAHLHAYRIGRETSISSSATHVRS